MNQKTAVFLVEIGFRKVADCPCVLTVAKCVQVFVAHFGAERRDKFSAFKAHLRRGTCKPPPPFALCYINFCTRYVLKVAAAFALYRIAEYKKSDGNVAFVFYQLQITNSPLVLPVLSLPTV